MNDFGGLHNFGEHTRTAPIIAKTQLDILMVEDDPDDVYLIRQLLAEDSRRRYSLSTAASLRQASSVLDEGTFDLVLLDLGLPDSSGLDTLRLLKDQSRSLPVVVLTGAHDDELGERAIMEGAEDYLPKALVSGFLLKRSINYAVERHRLLHEIRQRAEQDPLTGLPNRFMIYDKLEFTIDQSERTGWPFALVMADLDRFKQINDTHGHRFGDRVLKALASRLKRIMRKSDYVSRYGGDEFLMIVANYGGETELQELIAEKQQHLAQPYLIEHDQQLVQLVLGVSLGVTQWQRGDTADTLLEKADRKMYREKRR
jgi:diguanylate cyclase (GGDEF)-like protein